MGVFSLTTRLLTSWYGFALVVAALGVAVGILVFIYVFPGKPKIGVIDVPFTVITEDSSYVISELLDYARRDDSIKAVVIRLSTPGGGAAASERLYVATRKLRERKPVVLVMNGLVASGGYMMAMGASHTYTQTSSLVGNVGVVAFSGPLIPRIPDEDVLFSGPYKLDGYARREWIATIDQLKSAFAQMVISERGDKLRISRDELVRGRIYSGLDAVKLGLADEIGGDRDAFEKAAELAGVSHYSTVGVNLKVLEKLVKDLERILPPSGNEGGSALADALALLARGSGNPDPVLWAQGEETDAGVQRLRALQDLALYGKLGSDQEDPLPDFPLNISHPNVYYLYVGNGP